MSVTLVAQLMTTEVVTLNEDDDFVSADQVMRLQHVRHLPVVRGKKLVGLVTHRDLIRAQSKLLWSIPNDGAERVVTLSVRDIMQKNPISCPRVTPADDAIRLMLANKLGCILVTHDEELVGIVTEADVVKWAIEVMAKQRFL
jgi:CBS domain-containing membrane protein